MLEGLVEIVARFIDVAEVVPGVCQFRVQQNCLLAMLEGFFITVQRMQHHAQVAVCQGVAGLTLKLPGEALNGQLRIAPLHGNHGGDFNQGDIIRMAAQQLFGEMACRLQVALLVQGNDLLELVGRESACGLFALATAAFVFLATATGAGGIPGRCSLHVFGTRVLKIRCSRKLQDILRVVIVLI